MRRRGSGWQLAVHVGRNPATGKPQYRYRVVQGNKRKAQTELAKFVAEMSDRPDDDPTALFSSLAERWFAGPADRLSGSTRREYRRLLDKRILPRWGSVQLADIKTAHLDAWYDDLAGSLSASSIRQIHSVIRRVLVQGVKWGLIAHNPARDASPPPQPSRRPEAPDAATVKLILESARALDPDVYTALRLAATTGARRGEICALRYEDIDFERATVTISRTVVQGVAATQLKDTTRNKQPRVVPLDATTVGVLEEHRSRRRAVAAQCGVKLGDDAYIFSRRVESDRWPDVSWLSHSWLRVTEQAGVQGVNLHKLRHFVGTMVMAEHDAVTTAEILGHSSTYTTLKYYAAAVPDRQRAAADTMSGVLDG